MESVRRAGPADLAHLGDLLIAATAEVATRRGGPLMLSPGPDARASRSEDPAAAIARWASDDDHRLMVGSIDGVPVGLAAGGLTGPPARRVGLLECCYVEPAARQVGVGSAMVTHLLEWFAEQGCDGVDAWALPGDRATKQLLEAAGLSARLLVLHRRLP